METATTTALAQLDGIRLSDWIEARGLSRSTAYELLKLMQIEPEARRVPTSRKPVSHLTADQLEVLDPLAAEINRGATLPQIRDRLGQCGIVPADSPERSAIVPDKTPGQLVALQPEQLVAMVAALRPEPPAAPVDPLKTARGLVEAADLGVALSTVELAQLLGLSASTVSGWDDGHTPRPGFVVHRSKVGQSVWWKVERIEAQRPQQQLPPAPAEHRGFAGLLEEMARPAAYQPPLEASYRVIARELFNRNTIGGSRF